MVLLCAQTVAAADERVGLECDEVYIQARRARNLSGIILIDFINLSDAESTARLLSEFRSHLAKDPIQATLVDMTALGLVEVTRKKVRKPLYEEEKN